MTTFHYVQLRPKQLSVEEASKMSLDELEISVKESENGATTTFNEGPTGRSYIHIANAAMAYLIKKGKTLPDTLQTTFDAWKNANFSAANSLDFFSECLQYYSSREDQKKHCRFLKKYSLNWHLYISYQIDFHGDDSHRRSYHVAQHCAIEFIYRGLRRLSETDVVVFKKCIREGTLYDICELAKKVYSSGHYSKETVEGFVKSDLCHDDKKIDADRIILLRNAFESEIRIAMNEKQYIAVQKDLKALNIVFDLKSAIHSKDPKNFVEVYEQCFTKMVISYDIKKLFTKAFQAMWDILIYKQRLERLSNKTGDSTDNQSTDLLKKVVEPALILLKSKRILHNKSLERRERAFSNFLQLDYDDDEDDLLIEKCRDYVRHEDDFEYIRKDYEGIRNRVVSLDKLKPYHLVKEIVQELEKDPNDQKCSFDLTSKKLICSSPKMWVHVEKLLKNKMASRIMQELFEDAIAKQSLSTAIDNFKAQAKSHRVLIDADEDVIKALNPTSFF